MPHLTRLYLGAPSPGLDRNIFSPITRKELQKKVKGHSNLSVREVSIYPSDILCQYIEIILGLFPNATSITIDGPPLGIGIHLLDKIRRKTQRSIDNSPYSVFNSAFVSSSHSAQTDDSSSILSFSILRSPALNWKKLCYDIPVFFSSIRHFCFCNSQLTLESFEFGAKALSSIQIKSLDISKNNMKITFNPDQPLFSEEGDSCISSAKKIEERFLNALSYFSHLRELNISHTIVPCFVNTEDLSLPHVLPRLCKLIVDTSPILFTDFTGFKQSKIHDNLLEKHLESRSLLGLKSLETITFKCFSMCEEKYNSFNFDCWPLLRFIPCWIKRKSVYFEAYSPPNSLVPPKYDQFVDILLHFLPRTAHLLSPSADRVSYFISNAFSDKTCFNSVLLEVIKLMNPLFDVTHVTPDVYQNIKFFGLENTFGLNASLKPFVSLLPLETPSTLITPDRQLGIHFSLETYRGYPSHQLFHIETVLNKSKPDDIIIDDNSMLTLEYRKFIISYAASKLPFKFLYFRICQKYEDSKHFGKSYASKMARLVSYFPSQFMSFQFCPILLTSFVYTSHFFPQRNEQITHYSDRDSFRSRIMYSDSPFNLMGSQFNYLDFIPICDWIFEEHSPFHETYSFPIPFHTSSIEGDILIDHGDRTSLSIVPYTIQIEFVFKKALDMDMDIHDRKVVENPKNPKKYVDTNFLVQKNFRGHVWKYFVPPEFEKLLISKVIITASIDFKLDELTATGFPFNPDPIFLKPFLQPKYTHQILNIPVDIETKLKRLAQQSSDTTSPRFPHLNFNKLLHYCESQHSKFHRGIPTIQTSDDVSIGPHDIPPTFIQNIDVCNISIEYEDRIEGLYSFYYLFELSGGFVDILFNPTNQFPGKRNHMKP
ncbi:hypothetical protein ADUPG1_000361 [Aduncisulcus paluster]|uniref:Uncharacterized protein n=1 Tax=Aduncisulcus paluster TaxID=2918883 RepID=A0ABQ5K611_9EUKA|nr:hypothetical protein ADUPG1_000361 [Aduncisulcus paluster]